MADLDLRSFYEELAAKERTGVFAAAAPDVTVSTTGTQI